MEPMSTSLVRPVAPAVRKSHVLLPEIQGLRAVAVGLVFAFHLWPERIPGGFIGVDIFFVISGYLIIGHLLRQLRDDGRVDLAGFWTRRIRRILPLALVVLFATAIASWFLAQGEDRIQYLEEIIASVFFSENWLLAYNAVDYIRADYDPSPVQQFWSLGVEEQFYLLLPVLFALVVFATRRRQQLRSRAVLILLAGLFTASLIASVLFTTTSPETAYFATPLRLWEFLAGGLAAFTAIRIPRRWSTLAATAGTAAIILSAFLINEETAFPGWVALVPVVGTLAVIAAGHESWFGRLSTFAPVLWVGGISYGIYLWHWPIIQFTPGELDQIGITTKAFIIAGTLVLAWITKRTIEDPARFASTIGSLRLRKSTVGIAAITAMSLVAGTAWAGINTTNREQAELLAYVEAIASGGLECFGAESADPALACPSTWDGPILPPLQVLRSDDSNRAECWSGDSPPTVNICTLGPESGYELRALALGDSYNGALVAAYETTAELNNWQIDVASRRSCGWSSAPTSASRSEACLTWNELIDEYLDEAEPYDVIFTTAAGRSASESLVVGYQETWQAHASSETLIIAIASPPRTRNEYIACLNDHPDSINEECSLDRSEAFSGIDALSVAAASTDHVEVLDLNDLICPGDPCTPVVGNAIAYRNSGHLTRTFVETLGPYLAERAADLIATHR